MDSYAPSRRQGNDRPPVYQFRGRDSRPSQGDSYRPTDFDFRSRNDYQGRPPISFSQSAGSTLPNGPTSNRQGRTNQPVRRGHPGGNNNNNNNNNNFSRQQNRQRFQRPSVSDRPLLRSQKAPTPEQLLGMYEGAARFKNPEELSNSEEEDMELATDAEAQISESHDTDDEPSRKRLRRSRPSGSDNTPNAIPKWSNPDPYTSLPPPDETHGKRKDVVKLIRKAKASAGGNRLSASAAEDFISFSMDDEDDEDDIKASFVDQSHAVDSRVPGAPAGPKISQLDNLNSNRTAPGVSTASISIDTLGPPPPLPKELKDTRGGEKIEIWPPPPKPQQADGASVGRKRAHSEVSQGSKSGKKKGRILTASGIVPEWIPKNNRNPTPWLQMDHTSCESMGVRLHKELCDFYDFVKPRKFESEIRHALVQGISRFVDDFYRGAQVSYFGSFAAGTYLPDADMDLVVLSQEFRERGRPTIGQRQKELHQFAHRLQQSGIAKPGSTVTIWKAKVPLVKYIDNCTGLRCDISFENGTGPIANKTYADWKAQFPALPAIVSTVKQFLVMRGMNEVHTGGLGSFAVNCLVVSLMQHMPQLSTENMDPTRNLGEIFMNFLDFYGNKFNQTAAGIELRPPRYFPKHTETRVKYDPNRAWKLCIIDPNKPENDISSGTTNIVAILKSFSSAYKTMQDRMNELRSRRRIDNSGLTSATDLSDTSILSSLYAGDYSSFEHQRERMWRLYTESVGPSRCIVPAQHTITPWGFGPTQNVAGVINLVHRHGRFDEDDTRVGGRAEGALLGQDMRTRGPSTRNFEDLGPHQSMESLQERERIVRRWGW